jgi:proline dehydrogenase
MMLGSALLSASRSPRLRQAVTSVPATRTVVDRFVAGERGQDAVAVAAGLVGRGLLVTVDHLGEDTTDVATAGAVRTAYVDALAAFAEAGIAKSVEVSVKLSAVGQALPVDGEQVSLANARAICEAAAAVGTTVTFDMEDHTTVDRTLAVVQALREDFGWVGCVLQSMLRRTEGDCRDLAGPGSRVRLVKGAYREPESVAYQGKSDVDRSYVRCLRTLMDGEGYPMVGSHDPRLVGIATLLADRAGRDLDGYEFQMLYGVRPDEQRRLADEGHRVRVYLPYGTDWYGYFMRRLAERPANVGFLLRALASRG